MPSTSENISSSVSLFTVSLSTHLMSTVAPSCHEACFNASITDKYASWSSMYFPTIAIVTLRLEEWILSIMLVHSERSTGRSGRPRIFTATLSSPSSWSISGASYRTGTVLFSITHSLLTLQKREIFSFIDSSIGSSLLMTMTSGNIPVFINSFTECWAGFDLCSPEA